jgi:hypothetical protein
MYISALEALFQNNYNLKKKSSHTGGFKGVYSCLMQKKKIENLISFQFFTCALILVSKILLLLKSFQASHITTANYSYAQNA